MTSDLARDLGVVEELCRRQVPLFPVEAQP
jgi:hypothetical protein